MGDRTGISWTDATWNPIRGCSRVSEGCRNCYAERVAARFSGPGQPYEGLAANRLVESMLGLKTEPRWTGEVRMVPEMLDQPLRWTKPRRVFVNSMSDLFHEKLTDDHIAAIFGVMAAAPRHTFQVLTKRPERMRAWFAWIAERGGLGRYIRSDDGREALRPIVSNDATSRIETLRGKVVRSARDGWAMVMNAAACHFDQAPLENVWLGVSVEDQKTANERVPLLLQTPAAVRFVSAEPLLGPVDLGQAHGCCDPRWGFGARDDALANAVGGKPWGVCFGTHVDWVIAGGESGPGARHCDVAWIRSIVAQCRDAGVACFVKQLGSYAILDPRYDRSLPGATRRLAARKGDDPQEWPEGLRVQQFPAASAALLDLAVAVLPEYELMDEPSEELEQAIAALDFTGARR